MKALIDKLVKNKTLTEYEFINLLENRSKYDEEYLFIKSRQITDKYYKNKIYIRGLIEITNYCKNNCYYCGIRSGNKQVSRYRLNKNEILESCAIGYKLGFRTFVLQGGEDNNYTDEILYDIVFSIKQQFSDCAVTLSLGERDKASYLKLKQAGADRYLLRFETTNNEHYKKLHPSSLSPIIRKECLNNLKQIGYATGGGFMVGSPFQTYQHIAQDLLYLAKLQPQMVGIGPFLSHHATPFSNFKNGSLEDTIFILGIVRIMLPTVLLPATTALATLHPQGREMGIKVGANVIMPNLSPLDVRSKYMLYDNKAITGLESAQLLDSLKNQMMAIGYEIVIDRGDNAREEEIKMIYNAKSKKTDEFINHNEIIKTLNKAKINSNNLGYINQIIEKAKLKKGLNYQEAASLLACDDDEIISKIYLLAKEIKDEFYGNRIVIFAPLYLSNYCVNGCIYCPYHYQNTDIQRRKLTQEEIMQEVIALQDMGHKRLAIESGEDNTINPIEYILESINTIYSVKHKNGDIRRVNVNIAATTVENYKKLADAKIGTYILFQETYNKTKYELMHPTGPKHNYNYHTEAMDRAMEGGIDDVGLGVLFGLEDYQYEFIGLMMHKEHLEARFGVGPHTISMPRIRPADDVDPENFGDGISDDIFAKIVAITRITVPYTGIIISTRESQSCREKVLKLGASQISGGSKTSVGGYSEKTSNHDLAKNTEQFDIDDNRTLDDIVKWLINLGYTPSFCTACYREGRTGDRFMQLCKSGQIINCCHPNSLMTLKEYLMDYASEETRSIGEKIINEQIHKTSNHKIKELAISNLKAIENGQRDFRF